MSAAMATVIVGALSLIGTVIGSWSGTKLTIYRIEQLEKKVEKHNNLVERMYRVEESTAVQEEQIKVANHRLEDLERKVG